MTRRHWFAVLAAAATSTLVAGCAPVLVAGAVGGTALVVADRRSTGTEVDDEGIELKLENDIGGAGFGDQVHVNVTSYDGIVLLTGEAPTQDLVAQIAEMARRIPKVRRVENEIVVGPVTSLSSRTNDSYITSKVKSRFVEANKFYANHVKVVTERQVVYLMGIVKHDEGEAAGQIAATTSGVVRVVKLFEYIP